jgi:hypothetical protein
MKGPKATIWNAFDSLLAIVRIKFPQNFVECGAITVGGLGSGKQRGRATKGLCGARRQLDIRDMRRQGALRIGAKGILAFVYQGKDWGRIAFEVHADYLELDYYIGKRGEDKCEAVNQHIRFDIRDQPFGGTRKYFLCPDCNGRCLVLYGERLFICRECLDLAYASQNEGAMDRKRRKARKLRKQLGGSENLFSPFPPKPKGMHWRTYIRLREQNTALEEQIFGNLAKLTIQLSKCL